MDIERTIAEIEQLQEMFEVRPLSTGDISAAYRRHDEVLAQLPREFERRSREVGQRKARPA
jgi:hypothetical protein